MSLTLPEDGIRMTALVRHNSMLLLREPGPVISRFVQPLVLITLMRPLYLAALRRNGAQEGTAQVVTGMMVMFSLLALSVVGTGILTERSWRTWDRLRATPARAGELLAAKAIPTFAMLVVLQIEVIVFGVLAFGLRVGNPALLTLAVAAWALALLGIGTALGAVLRSQSELNVAYDIGGILFSALGGALIPQAELPGWSHAIAPLSPGYWAMAAMRSALRGQTMATVRDAAVLSALGIVAGAIAAWRMSRGLRRSRLL
jgi:ABC-2 type transport system permease protein